MAKRPKPLTVAAYVKAGELKVPSRAVLLAALKGWPDGPVDLEVRAFEETRRARANRWLFGPVYTAILIEQCGRVTSALKDDLHEAMKLRHNPKTITDPITGEEKVIGGPTHKMKVEDFGQFIEAVMLDGAEAFGIVYPEPRKSEEWRDGTEADVARAS